jgi:hypothetical protein
MVNEDKKRIHGKETIDQDGFCNHWQTQISLSTVVVDHTGQHIGIQ